MSSENTHMEHSDDLHEANAMTKGRIVKVLLILLGITIVEFILALAVPPTVMPHGVKNFCYVVLTLVKAFYIVGFFMHLKFEKYSLIVAVLVAFVFIIYFIVLMLTEGNYMSGHMNL